MRVNYLYFIALALIFSACGGGSSGDRDTTTLNDTPTNQERNIDESEDELAVEDEINSSTTATVEEVKEVYIASSNQAYIDLNIKRDRVDIWEDGMRTDGLSGSYEWWYSDFIFSDGTTVAVGFYSKLLFDTYGRPFPLVTINITYPGGRKIDDNDFAIGEVLNASKERADVKIKDSYLKYKDGSYILHYSHNKIKFDVTMDSPLPMWRPKTGHIYFGKEGDYFAWLLAQPSSIVQAKLEINGVSRELRGIGYHDHNWGNSPLHENIDNWYWGRAKVGEYSLVFSDIIAHESYSYERVPILMISKGDKILKLNDFIEVKRESIVTDSSTDKSYANLIRFESKDTQGKRYVVEVKRDKNIASVDMNRLPFETGERPTYLRSLSDITLKIIENNKIVDTYNGKGIVEQISFYDKVEDRLED